MTQLTGIELAKLVNACISVAASGAQQAFELTENPDMRRVQKSEDELSLEKVDMVVQREMAETLFIMTKDIAAINVRGEDLDKPIIVPEATLTAWLDCPDGTQNSVTFHRDFVAIVSVFDEVGPWIVVSYVPGEKQGLAYVAVRGEGAYVLVYDKATKAEQRHGLPLTNRYKNFPVILTDWPWSSQKKRLIAKFMSYFADERLSFRMLGSAGYEATLLSEGKAAAMVHTDLKTWEYAITLLISEAGGLVWSQQVNDNSWAVVASMDHPLHNQLVDVMNKLSRG